MPAVRPSPRPPARAAWASPARPAIRAVQPHDGGFWRWTRLNLFDGWQVLGTIGLLAGVFVLSIMLAQTKHVLPSTGSAFQLVQTLVTDRPTPQASPEPSPAASAAPASV